MCCASRVQLRWHRSLAVVAAHLRPCIAHLPTYGFGTTATMLQAHCKHTETCPGLVDPLWA
jgi:hypothetical protein